MDELGGSGGLVRFARWMGEQIVNGLIEGVWSFLVNVVANVAANVVVSAFDNLF